MRRGIDTTDYLVYGHEAWIVTDKSVYEPGEGVHRILRSGHYMRPDGFFRLDEFRAFVCDEAGNRIALAPVKELGDDWGDYYELNFTPLSRGIHTIMVIYDNNYVRNEKDGYLEGDRRIYPDILDAKNYPQIYETCIAVGDAEGKANLCNKPFRNGSGDTQKAIGGCCIDSAGITGGAAVIQLIIRDAVRQHLGFSVRFKAEIPKI